MFNTSKISALTGATGATGAQGIQGIQGVQGDAGADGDDYSLTADQSWTGSQRGAVEPITIAANVATAALDAGNNFSVSIPASPSTEITFSFPSTAADAIGQSGVIKLTQGGAATTFNTLIKFKDGTVPTASTSGYDLLAYYVDTSTTVSATYLTNVKNP